VVVILAANHKKGTAAIKALFDLTRTPENKVPTRISFLGGISIRIYALTSNKETVAQHMKLICAKNLQDKTKSYVKRIKGVNSDFNENVTEWSLEASNAIQHCIGVIPATSDGREFLGVAIILQPSVNVDLRGDKYYKTQLYGFTGSLFDPQHKQAEKPPSPPWTSRGERNLT